MQSVPGRRAGGGGAGSGSGYTRASPFPGFRSSGGSALAAADASSLLTSPASDTSWPPGEEGDSVRAATRRQEEAAGGCPVEVGAPAWLSALTLCALDAVQEANGGSG